MHQSNGVTALELMVTMAIVAVMLAMGVPALKSYTWNLRLRTAVDALQMDMNLARGRAISHNLQTIICPTSGAADCSGSTQWQDGWIIFTDLDSDRQRQDGEALLKYANATEFLTISSSRSRTYLRFFPNGTAPGSNASIWFCDKRGAQYARRVIVSNSGRIRTETGTAPSSANCP